MDGMVQHFQREAQLAGAKLPGGSGGEIESGGGQAYSPTRDADADDIGSMIRIEKVDPSGDVGMM